MRIEDLAINTNGFAFDPTTGETFTLNETAKEIIEALIKGMDEKKIAKKIAAEYDVAEEEAFNDVLDFKEKLKFYGLIS